MLLYLPESFRQIQIDFKGANFVEFGTFAHPSPDENRYVIYLVQIKLMVLSVIYIKTEPLIGLITFVWGQLGMMFMIWLRSMDENQEIFSGQLFRYLLMVHLLGWTTQIVGHGIFERRAPALLTNLLFAYIAPFFWTFEVLNKLFGYR